MRIPIMNLDSVGIIKDVRPQDLPPSAFSDGRNVRFVDGRAQKTNGYSDLFTPGFPPQYVYASRWANDLRWVYASATEIYQRQVGGTFDNLTGVVGGYNTPNHDLKWQGGHYNGIEILNNGWDTPQVRQNMTQQFNNLTGFPAGKRTRSIRGFKNYFVALEMISTLAAKGVWGTHQVWWSHPVDAGALPSNWDITDPTKDAGMVPLGDTDGSFVDQMTMRGANFLYKDDCIYLMQHIGGNDIFSFKLLSEMSGAMMTGGVKKFITPNGGERHVVFGPWDIYVHDGQTYESILDKKMRRWVYSNMNKIHAERAFVAHHPPKREMWFCFPTGVNVWPDTALVWNYKDNTIALVDVPGISHMEQGPIGLATAATSTTSMFDYLEVMIASSPTLTRVLEMDKGTSFRGAPITATLERQGLTILGKDLQTGKLIQDSDVNKLVTEVWPRFEGTYGTQIDISLGSQMGFDEPVVWQPAIPYIIGKDRKINTNVVGKIISIKFETQTIVPWTLAGYDLEIRPAGGY